jgi:hypothetical protein
MKFKKKILIIVLIIIILLFSYINSKNKTLFEGISKNKKDKLDKENSDMYNIVMN